MATMEDFKKILVRNIPTRIWAALETLAGKHDRSVEAEARQALNSWVQPELTNAERSNRELELSRRLQKLLEQSNSGRRGAARRPSHIAEAIGEASAGDTEKWFHGEKEPTFLQLAAIAAELGASKNWLLHGDGSMYPTEYERPSQDATEAVKWFLDWSPENEESTEKTAEIHLVREDDKTGRLAIVKISGRGHPKIFMTPIHVSQETGNGGRSDLAHFAVTLSLLYKHYTKLGSKISVSSCLLKTADFTILANGNTHPAKLLEKASTVLWWEDIWDRSMFTKHEYWDGWSALCESIDRTIGESRHLSEQRGVIKARSGNSLEELTP